MSHIPCFLGVYVTVSVYQICPFEHQGSVLSLQQCSWYVWQFTALTCLIHLYSCYEEYPSANVFVLFCICCWYRSWSKTSKYSYVVGIKNQTDRKNTSTSQRANVIVTHLGIFYVESSGLDWVSIRTDIAGGMFKGSELWIQQHSSWAPLFRTDLAFCDFTGAYAVSSFCLGQFSLNNYWLHSPP